MSYQNVNFCQTEESFYGAIFAGEIICSSILEVLFYMAWHGNGTALQDTVSFQSQNLSPPPTTRVDPLKNQTCSAFKIQKIVQWFGFWTPIRKPDT